MKWGLKLGVWTGTFLLASMTISTYRNKSGVLEHIVGGALVGIIFKFSMGPKGMAAGAAIGTLYESHGLITRWFCFEILILRISLHCLMR
jgi:hypothetical protein